MNCHPPILAIQTAMISMTNFSGSELVIIKILQADRSSSRECLVCTKHIANRENPEKSLLWTVSRDIDVVRVCRRIKRCFFENAIEHSFVHSFLHLFPLCSQLTHFLSIHHRLHFLDTPRILFKMVRIIETCNSSGAHHPNIHRMLCWRDIHHQQIIALYSMWICSYFI